MRITQLACVMFVVSASCASLDDATTYQPGAPAPSPASGGEPAPVEPPTQPVTPITPIVPPTVVSGTWAPLVSVPLLQAGFMQLLTDGTVLVSEIATGKWFRLTPDLLGSYLHGTWSQIAQMPTGYAPLYFGSGVLPDGRLMIEGGEYNGPGQGVWTTLGAVYDVQPAPRPERAAAMSAQTTATTSAPAAAPTPAPAATASAPEPAPAGN